MTQRKSKKGAWIALFAVLAWLGLVFALDQLIKPTDKLGMLLIIVLVFKPTGLFGEKTTDKV